MAAPITKLRIGLKPDTPEEHTRLLINVNTEEAQTALQITTDLRVRANPATAKIYYYNYDGSELLYTETIEPGGNGSWDGEPGRASTAQYEFIFNGWALEPDQVDPTEDATAGVYSSRRVYAAYKRRDISGVLKFWSDERIYIELRKRPHAWEGDVFVSTDAISWTVWEGFRFDSAQINGRHQILMKGKGNTVICKDDSNSGIRVTTHDANSTAPIHCEGDVRALLDSDLAAAGEDPPMGAYCFKGLFYACKHLVSAPSMPKKAASRECFAGMFSFCTALKTPPELPDENIIYYGAYKEMFWGAGIETAPALPSVGVPGDCYNAMFRACLALKKPPRLPATQFYASSMGQYRYMFADCTALESLPELPAQTLPRYAYADMFNGCTKIRVSETESEEYATPFRIPTAGAGTAASDSLSGMFAGTGGTFTGTPEINTTYYLAPPAST